jgi:DNA-binding NarL/FixJ family response regulator
MQSMNTDMARASRSRRLVIVADNSLIVEAIRIGFRKSGEFNFLGHADGRKTAVRTIVAAEPDVILVDDMDQSERAIELIREITAQGTAVSAVIVLTMQMDPEWLERLSEAGATGAISKATHPLALATLVREMLNGHVFHTFASQRAPSAQLSASLAVGEFSLTEREVEILGLVASGSTNSEVARQLWVTEQTVKFHLRNIYRKLGVANRTQASHFAYVNRLAGPKVAVAPKAQPELSAAS